MSDDIQRQQLDVQKGLYDLERKKLEAQQGCARAGCGCLLVPLIPFALIILFFIVFWIAEQLGLVK